MAKAKTKADSKENTEKKKIDLIKEIVSAVAGQNASKIVDILYGKNNVNEFDISKKMNMTINQTRNILYKLSDDGIVSFIKKKDKKSGGWYTYFWTLNLGKSFLTLKNKLLREIFAIDTQLSTRKSQQFYFCPNGDMEMSEENALLIDFTCPECGEVLELRDNSQSVSDLETASAKLKATLADVENELSEISKKEEASVQRRMKNEERKKKAERELRKAERAKEKAKLAGKSPKKETIKSPKAKASSAKKAPAKKKGDKKAAKGKSK